MTDKLLASDHGDRAVGINTFFARGRAIAVAMVLGFVSLVAIAADLRVNISSGYRHMVVEGVIEKGDYERFIRIAKENQGELSGISIFSPGGDFVEAMKIGRAMRALEMSSQAPMRSRSNRPVCDDDAMRRPVDPANCTTASAGFFIHIGAVHRGGTYLAVHRPYFARDQFAKLSESQASAAFEVLQKEARSYMTDMGVPPQVQEDILATPSDKALLLDERTIKTYFWGEPPARHEWRKAKCGRLSDDEAQRLEMISTRLVSTSGGKLSADDLADLKVLQPKADMELKCQVALIKESRLAAYEKFFGAKPSDTTNQNFSKWVDAPKYLRRPFEEIVSEERFELDKDLAGTSSMSRPATASSPHATLMDSRQRRKYVAWVGLVSGPNPSADFLQRLKTSMEAAWGKPTSTNGLNEWAWKGQGFTARLKHESVSSTGPYLSLVVEDTLE